MDELLITGVVVVMIETPVVGMVGDIIVAMVPVGNFIVEKVVAMIKEVNSSVIIRIF